MENTAIEWATHTFNPWIGCTKVSEGCKHCYAETDQDKRRGRVKWGPNGTRSKTSEANWRKPLLWNRQAAKDGVRRRVFCASLADVFEDWQGPILHHSGTRLLKCDECGAYHSDDEAAMSESCRCGRFKQRMEWATMNDLRRDLFKIIVETPHLDWLLLTKRPENACRMLGPDGAGLYAHADGPVPCPQPNVWIGCSVENQATAEARIPHLERCPAAVRFVSYEPALGAVLFDEWIKRIDHCASCDAENPPHDDDVCPECGESDNTVSTWGEKQSERYRTGERYASGGVQERDEGCQLDWIIIGGESGPGSRPFDLQWARDTIRQCRDAGVAVFFKQAGKYPVETVECSDDGTDATKVIRWRLRDKKGGDLSELPADVRVREFPGRRDRE